WLKRFDLHMKQQKRHICLLVNNFSGDTVSYQPPNIHLEFFKPNMTSFVQPCDVGIIHCFKALYHHSFVHVHLTLMKWEIYKISLLEGMTMAKKAWDQVTPEMVQHCWNHMQVQLLTKTIIGQ
ncbi:hypothetical protein PAXRUDRAFT_165979, partial [Paxillus rubicundulus Ve08.2h10]